MLWPTVREVSSPHFHHGEDPPVAETAFLLSGQRRRPKPKHLPWNLSVRGLWGNDPLTDSSGCRMRFVKHLPPVAA
jgi:hypothetical protein